MKKVYDEKRGRNLTSLVRLRATRLLDTRLKLREECWAATACGDSGGDHTGLLQLQLTFAPAIG